MWNRRLTFKTQIVYLSYVKLLTQQCWGLHFGLKNQTFVIAFNKVPKNPGVPPMYFSQEAIP